MVERLQTGNAVWVPSVAAMSSTLHRVAGQRAAAGFLVAMAITVTRSEGGKAPRSSCARRILKACKPLGKIAPPPQARRMAITAHLGSEPKVGRLVRCRRP